MYIDRNVHKWEEKGLRKFDVVFDPYFDLHLEKAVNQMETERTFTSHAVIRISIPIFQNMKMKRPLIILKI